MKTFLCWLVLLSGCSGVVDTTPDPQPKPDTFVPCERHVRKLFGNVNGCWRITSRQGFVDANDTFMCAAEPTCEVIPGEDRDYLSGDVAWVGDVECDNTCK
jgi:hypothetical protein